MKTPILFAACVASLLAFSASDLVAQQPRSGQPPVSGQPQFSGQPPAGAGPATQRPPAMGQSPAGVVAVIDLNKVMNKYSKAQNLVQKLQKDGMAADTQLRKDNAQIEALKESLKDIKPGTADWKRREEEIAQRTSDLKVHASIEQRDFQEQQMKAMYMIYREITAEVQRYAQANGLGLVMDYSNDPVDMNVPQSIQRAVSRPFVYQGGPDITDVVLAALERNAVAQRQSDAGGTGAVPTRR